MSASYAREDTHYLLYIFDRLRQDLHQAEGRTAITAVMDAGRDFCCLRYKKDGEGCAPAAPRRR